MSDAPHVPPHDLYAEQCVLGSMLRSEWAGLYALRRMEPADFYRLAHQDIFEAVGQSYEQGAGPDAVVVKHAMEQQGRLKKCGGVDGRPDAILDTAGSLP